MASPESDRGCGRSGTDRAGPGQRLLRSPWLAPALGALCFVNSLRNGFAYDDYALILDNPRIRTLTDFRGVWLSDWWYPTEGASDAHPKRDRLYRPLSLLSFALNYAVHEYRPGGYHLVNLVLHAGVCLLVWHFARRLTGDAAVASLTAALFAVHPVHADAVASVVGRAEVLAALFLLAGLLLLLGRRTGDGPLTGSPSVKGWQRGLAAAPLFLLALLSKETAICYPAVALLALHGEPQAERRPLRWWLGHALVLALPLLVYLPLRFVALEGYLFRREPAGVWMNPLVTATGLERVLGAFTVLGHYLRLLVVPARLSCDYGLAIVDPQAGFTAMTLLGFAAAGGIVLGLSGFLRQTPLWRLVATITAITVASYILISNTILLIGVALAERLMYWPSVPALTLAGLGVAQLGRRYCVAGGPLEKSTRLLRVLGVLLLSALALRTIVRNTDWESNWTLASRDVTTYPQGAHLNRGYAAELIRLAESGIMDPSLRRQHLDRADQHLAAALRIDPAYADALGMRARVRAALGDVDRAFLYAESALLLDPANADALRVLARLKGADVGAEPRLATLREDTQRRPDDPNAWLALGAALLEQGKPYEARQPLERAATLAPGNVDVARSLGTTLALLGHKDRAIAQFRKVLAASPDDWATHTNLSSLLAERDAQAALEHARRAYQLRPTDVRTAVNLAEVYVRLGHKSEALALYRQIVRALDQDDPFRQVIQKRIEHLQRR